ncbi:ABC transporter substrate-binding protein [Magnetovibrio sp.]|uniref:ABC transporter substrate-binding protein n=1 Tax=Magnetovibrio sp. TaxID=2024836 RepID=UPI002F92DC33
MSNDSRLRGACKTVSKVITRRRMLKGLVGAGACATVTTSTALGPTLYNIAHGATSPVRIGFPVPLSGPYSWEANEQVRCAQIAVDAFNATGGLDGRMAELLVRDDRLRPGEAAMRTLELIEDHHVHFICGALSASVQLSVNAVARARQTIYMSISQSDAINESKDFSKYTFHEALNPHMTAGAVGRYVFPRVGKRVAFLVADYAYGYEMMRGFKRAGEAFGIETVAEVTHPIAVQDFSAFLPTIRDAKPDVLCLCNFGNDQMHAIKQAADLGLKNDMQLVAPVLLFNQRTHGDVTAYAGVIGGTNYYWTLEQQFASAKRFNDAYRDRFSGRVPSDYGAYGYAGVKALLDGVLKAGSVDTNAVIAALETSRTDRCKGLQHFRACDHQSVQSVLVLRSKAQEHMADEYDLFEVLDTESASEDNLRTCAELGHL